MTMPDPCLSILQVNSFERWGGAETVAVNLSAGLRKRGHEVTLAVGRRATDDRTVQLIPNEQDAGPWNKAVHAIAQTLGASPHSPLVDRVASPRRIAADLRGMESFDYPGTAGLLNLSPRRPSVLHMHNLHGQYFDLRQLPRLSQEIPTFMTLHDNWLMTGHCAYSHDCDRWRHGCGQCPDLSIYPALIRDGTAGNWTRKKNIYAASKLHIATPCQWLMDRVNDSMLADGVVETKVINYGIDLAIYQPGNKLKARQELGVPADTAVLLFVASGLRNNQFKDYQTLRSTIERLGHDPQSQDILLLALGDEAPSQKIGRAEIRFVPFESDPTKVASYFQAADLYLHAAKVDTFPCVVLEALACGTPVIATAVGGVPEQVRTLGIPGVKACGGAADLGSATGVLVPPGDDESMARATAWLLENDSARESLAHNAANDAKLRFDIARQVCDYESWYHSVLAKDPCRGSS